MGKEQITTASAESLLAAAKNAEKEGDSTGLPPVHLWDPDFCGDIDMRIARDGTWFYEGSKIERPGLVRLFSTIMKLENGKYFLVTPAEKVGITVDDAPFVAIDVNWTGDGADQVLSFETNVGDTVVAGPNNPIRVVRDQATGEPSPYVEVRAGLEALIDRKSFYRLIDIGAHHNGWFGLWSAGQFFDVIPSEDMMVD